MSTIIININYIVADFTFGGSKITAVVTAALKLKDAYSLEGKL